MRVFGWVAGIAFIAACSKENNVNVQNGTGGSPGVSALGKACKAAAECDGGTCVAGICRLSCQADVECDTGSICFADGAASGCRLPDEGTCETPGKACKNAALTCGLDKTCRLPCTTSCARVGQTCIAGACVDAAEPGASDTFFSCKGPHGPSGKGCDDTALFACNETAPGKTPLATCATSGLCAAAVTANTSSCAAPACEATALACGGPGEARVQRCKADRTGFEDLPGLAACSSKANCVLSIQGRSTTAPPTACTEPVCAAGEGRCVDGVASLCNASRTGFDTVATCSGATAQCNPGAGSCVGIDLDATEVTRAAYKVFLDAIGDADTTGSVATKPPAQPAACSANTDFTPTAFWTSEDQKAGSAPVSGVDWCDARAYCASVGRRLCGRIGGGMVGLGDFGDASKSEWQNMCSAGGKNTYPYGVFDPDTCNGAGNWATEDTPVPVAVGSKASCAANATGYAGRVDLSGNVAEWEDACGALEASGTGADLCRVRGGSYLGQKDALACAHDRTLARGSAAPDVGFRCCQ